ncbi:MAG: MmcQ/YjbR family DNA-binding protein [Paramuribaculum sp.]|nr:MmcQ/YjbR family DNA-binding protein [Paramuribaculum sp.]
MNIETIREYCLSLPLVTEDMAFGEEHLLVRVCGKIFGCLDLVQGEFVTLKSDPDYAVELRDRYAEIIPAWHWNKKYWNQVSLEGSIPDDLIKSLIRHSYGEVVKKLPARIKKEFPQILDIQ